MKILFFIESLQSGGKERRAVELITYLKERSTGYEMELVLTEAEIHFEEIYKTGIPITVLKRRGFKYDPGLFSRFYRICRRFRPDVIHTWGKMSTFYAIPSRLLCGTPLVANLISDTLQRSGKYSFYAFLKKINIFFSDAVLSNSVAGLRTYNIHTSKAKVIYNGVELSRFSFNPDARKVRKELNIRRKYVVIMVATFSELKDYDLFLNVALATSRLRDDVCFLAVGDGPLFDHIRERIRNESIGNVILAGRRTDVERLISASDIGILCSYSEGISNSIIEYMALGKPVIATDIHGGSRELITEGITGYCVERNTLTIRNLIEFLIDNPDLRNEMGKKGRQKVESFFSVSRMGREYEDLYESLVEQKARKVSLLHKAAGYR